MTCYKSPLFSPFISFCITISQFSHWTLSFSPIATPFTSHLHSHPNKYYSTKSTSASALFSSTASYINTASEDLQPGIQTINKHNDELESNLSKLRSLPYFRLYSCDMLGSCEYMPQELFECYSSTCEIYPIEEDEIPPSIKTKDFDEFEFDIDGWARWDMPSDDYYDIEQFQEKFTGYDGSMVWQFIHSRVCFNNNDYELDTWKSDFNKAVSGMHSMISAHIVSGIQTKIDNKEEFEEDCVWTDPTVEYVRRLSHDGENKKAIENLYFSYMLILSAVKTARDFLLQDFHVGDNQEEDEEAHEALITVLSSPLLQNDEEVLNEQLSIASKKLHDHAIQDEETTHTLWEARMRSRELLRIMNCVQCNKCRLHGKIAAMGLSTAFQLLLGNSGDGIAGSEIKKIHRVELAALMTTLSKFSFAVQYCNEMESKVNNTD
mmetsp:Transcript_27/g.24  ORF Transcript_27/g.24 Transcript_27/m.24 type:complete len:435 (+) Transcript_27:257-1561(+)